MELVITSSKLIKPSSPTPPHLRRLQLSFLDQLNPGFHAPFIFFYPPTPSLPPPSTLLRRLNTSLADSLSAFYPLAGRLLPDHSHIICDDSGVPFFEAQSTGHISHLINNPVFSDLDKLVPRTRLSGFEVVLAVQATMFACGGLAVGICCSHKFMDGVSVSYFFNSWAATCRGESGTAPYFGASKIFPPRETYNSGAMKVPTGKGLVAKRFVFSAAAVAGLKARYGSPDLKPSSSESVSAYIFNRFAAATARGGGTPKLYRVIQAINLRPKANPPLPECFFGNIIRFYMAKVRAPEGKGEDCRSSSGLVVEMREAMKKINGEYMKNLEEGKLMETHEMDDSEAFAITTVTRFKFYEADFGWGRPAWITTATGIVKNSICLMPTRSGDGTIEAVINITEEDMARLEADQEFLSYASPNYDSMIKIPSSL